MHTWPAPLRLCIPLLAWVAFVGCGPEATIEATAPPRVGTVTARVLSSFGVEDDEPGIELPSGLQVFVADGAGQPLADAVVRIYPGGEDPQPMVHQGGGRYELDVLTGRLAPPAPEYFFEVQSDFIEPHRVVLRVAHEHLTERPEIGTPEPRSEQPAGQAMPVMWFPVTGADCYDVGVREHELQSWTWVQECVDSTTVALDAAVVNDISFVRVRAVRSSGDETFATADFFSSSSSSAEVEFFLVVPEG